MTANELVEEYFRTTAARRLMNEDMHDEIHVADSSVCRVSGVLRETAVESISRSVGATGDTAAVEFTVPSLAAIDDTDEVFHHEQKTIYRVTHSFTEESQCACKLTEGHGCPVRHLETDCGAVALSSVTMDLESFRDTVVNFKPAFDGVLLRRFTQSEPDLATGSFVLVDRGELTVRQREILKMAHEMGYFEYPRKTNTIEVAAAPGINHSTFTGRPSAIQSKLSDMILDV